MPREDPELRNVTQIANIFKQIVVKIVDCYLDHGFAILFCLFGKFKQKIETKLKHFPSGVGSPL